ncbi:hypothetical protein [Nocardioides nematodiphilus]|uniref:hypothetical protein n=1 Tax=Nocardioides nematodiphilus TaxID=2849669 RepID=UPI001CD9B596|nr:hypothetical protein [Nocardioides nematodiphilus]MCA1984789.1 hypothetical protein [Nocardioides nematodiphilus]
MSRVQIPFGDAAGGYDFTGSATGTAPAVSLGSALGTYDFSGSASGSKPADPTMQLFNTKDVLKLEVDTTGTGGWSNIMDYLREISFSRDELDVGTLSATVISASYDPAKSSVLRPGRGLKLSALVNGTWSPIFTGLVSQATVAYDPARLDPEQRAVITLTGVDKTAILAKAGTTTGVGSLHDLAYVLNNMVGNKLTWNINGSSATISTPVTIPVDTSVLDQVAIARDSELGYAWVDRSGVLQAWSNNQISTTNKGVLDENVYNTALSIDYDTNRCINSVLVDYVHEDPDNPGSTITENFGPYVNQSSIDQWGTYSASFTVQGSAAPSASAVDTYAQSILAANAIPSVRVNSVVIPIISQASVSRALLDLYDLVTVKNTNAGINAPMRITGVSHSITPDKWLMQVDFSTDGTFSAPTVSAGQQLGQVENTAKVALDQAVSAMQQAQDALAQANQAAGFAQAAAQVYYQPTKPISGQDGDIWYDTDDGNRMRVYQASASDYVDATSSYLITPNGKLSITPNGISATDASNLTTFALDAATGNVTMKGSLTAGSSVTGATITGSTVQSSTTASRGIKFNSTAFIAYNNVGTPTFSIDAATGNVAMLGTLTSGSTITGATITGATISGGNFQTSTSSSLYYSLGTAYGENRLMGIVPNGGQGWMSVSQIGTGGAQVEISAFGNSTMSSIYVGGASGSQAISLYTGTITLSGAVNAVTSLSVTPGSFTSIFSDSASAFLRSPNGSPYIKFTGSDVILASLPSQTGQTVTRNATTAVLGYTGSARAVKVDIHELQEAPNTVGGSILDIAPVRYRDRHAVERYQAGDPLYAEDPRFWIGWIAEDFVAAGWEDLVLRDGEGAVNGLMYERVLPALALELRQRLQMIDDRLDELEAN